MFWDIDHLCEDKFVLFDWTFKVNLTNVVTEVKRLFYEGDKAIFDCNFNLGAFFDSPVESSRSFNRERLTAKTKLVSTMLDGGRDVRNRWVRNQIDFINGEDVTRSRSAVIERGFSRDFCTTSLHIDDTASKLLE